MRVAGWIVIAGLAAALILPTIPAQAGTVSVTVTDAATEAPLSKALVVVFGGNSVLAQGHTSNQGKWTGNIAAQASGVVAAKDLYATASKTVSYDAEANASITFKLRKHQSSDFKTLGRIVGFVRDGAGDPIPKATLVLLKKGTPVGAGQPKNPTGVYELQWYNPGTYTLLATAPGHADARYENQTISAGESLWLDVTLQAK